MLAWFLALPAGYLVACVVWLVIGVVVLRWLLRSRRAKRKAGQSLRGVHVGLSIWSLLALLSAVELYFALLFDTTDSFNVSNVSRVWFTRHVEPEMHTLQLRRNTGLDYRAAEPIPSRIPSDVRHVCFLGDSFTFGHGIESASDRFSDLVAVELGTASPGEYLVTNLSKPGSDLLWGNEVLKEVTASDIRVDVAVYVVCLNDIELFAPDYQERLQAMAGREPSFPLLRHTYFFNLLYHRLKLATASTSAPYYDYLAKEYDGVAWERMRDKLREFAETADDAGAEFRVVIFPFLHDLAGESPFDLAREKIGDFCESEAIPVLDLTPSLKPHAAEGLTVSRFDAHPNVRAHQIAADAITEFLLKTDADSTPDDESN